MTKPQERLSPSPDWGQLTAKERLLLLVIYFLEGLGLASLATFFSESVWYVRFGIIAVWLLPVSAYWWRPGLRSYLPGALLSMFGIFVGMVPGVLVEKLAEAAGAPSVVSRWLFVVISAAGMAGVTSLAFRQKKASGTAGKTPNEPVSSPNQPGD